LSVKIDPAWLKTADAFKVEAALQVAVNEALMKVRRVLGSRHIVAGQLLTIANRRSMMRSRVPSLLRLASPSKPIPSPGNIQMRSLRPYVSKLCN
jgi:hypothetical protein